MTLIYKVCASLSRRSLDGDRSVSPDDWATAVAEEVKENDGYMISLTNLASYYLSHLIVACRIYSTVHSLSIVVPVTEFLLIVGNPIGEIP